MTSIAALQRRVGRMVDQVDPRQKPKTWLFIVEAGKELPAHVRAQFAPNDTVILRETPAGYLSDSLSDGYKLSCSWVQ